LLTDQSLVRIVAEESRDHVRTYSREEAEEEEEEEEESGVPCG